MDGPLHDLADLLGRDVERAVENAAAPDGEPVEDVRLGIAEDLVDLAHLVAVARHDCPALLDDLPRDRIGHQAGRRPTRNVAPWVPTGWTSLRTRVMRTWPLISASS